MKSRLTLILILAFLPTTPACAQNSSLAPYRVDPTDSQYQKEEARQNLEREKQTALAKKLAEEVTRIRKNETPVEHMERLVDLLALRNDNAAPEPRAEPSESSDSQNTETNWYRTLSVYERLAEYQASSIPVLVAHLDDKRPSLGLGSNHYKYNTVGNACYENIKLQLLDRPEGYSRGVGFMRKGRDGEDHVAPYNDGTPFSEFYEENEPPHNDLKKWLDANKELSYPQMQIKCLTWLLEKEKAIGAPDAESYFLNILPLEIQILKRRLECGEKAETELAALERRQMEKRAGEIPPELLPEKGK